MTEKEKEELKVIIKSAISECQTCTLGIEPDTARELISFAATWKTCRKSMLVGVITVVAGGIMTALWAGIKQMVK